MTHFLQSSYQNNICPLYNFNFFQWNVLLFPEKKISCKKYIRPNYWFFYNSINLDMYLIWLIKLCVHLKKICLFGTGHNIAIFLLILFLISMYMFYIKLHPVQYRIHSSMQYINCLINMYILCKPFLCDKLKVNTLLLFYEYYYHCFIFCNHSSQ